MLASIMNQIWGILSIVAQIITLYILFAFFSPKLRNSSFGKFFRDHGLLVACVIAILSTAGSFIYSDLIGYAPCKLCWFQRIFMYPQVLLLGIAVYRKDQWMKFYGFILSVIGAAIALFHYTGQIGMTPLPCSAVGVSVSCSVRFVMEFGYITIPMMAFSAFLLSAVVLAFSYYTSKDVTQKNVEHTIA